MELITLKDAIFLQDNGKKSDIVSFSLLRNESIAISSSNIKLAENFFLVLVGLLPIHSGYINNKCNISWPLGSTEIFDVQLTFMENIHFILNIYPHNISEKEIRLRVNKYIGNTRIDYTRRMNSYNIRIRRIFSNALCFALEFDVYAQMKPIVMPYKNSDGSNITISPELNEIYKTNTFIFCNPDDELLKEHCSHVFNLDTNTKIPVKA